MELSLSDPGIRTSAKEVEWASRPLNGRPKTRIPQGGGINFAIPADLEDPGPEAQSQEAVPLAPSGVLPHAAHSDLTRRTPLWLNGNRASERFYVTGLGSGTASRLADFVRLFEELTGTQASFVRLEVPPPGTLYANTRIITSIPKS